MTTGTGTSPPTRFPLSVRPALPRPRGGAPGQPAVPHPPPAVLHPVPAIPRVPGWTHRSPRGLLPTLPPPGSSPRSSGSGRSRRSRPGCCSGAERLRGSSAASQGGPGSGPRDRSGRAPAANQQEERRGWVGFEGMAGFPEPGSPMH